MDGVPGVTQVGPRQQSLLQTSSADISVGPYSPRWELYLSLLYSIRVWVFLVSFPLPCLLQRCYSRPASRPTRCDTQAFIYITGSE